MILSRSWIQRFVHLNFIQITTYFHSVLFHWSCFASIGSGLEPLCLAAFGILHKPSPFKIEEFALGALSTVFESRHFHRANRRTLANRFQSHISWLEYQKMAFLLWEFHEANFQVLSVHENLANPAGDTLSHTYIINHSHTYVYGYVCVYIYTWLWIYIHIYIYTWLWLYIYIYIYIHTIACIHNARCWASTVISDVSVCPCNTCEPWTPAYHPEGAPSPGVATICDWIGNIRATNHRILEHPVFRVCLISLSLCLYLMIKMGWGLVCSHWS